jgi:hypothetical protein
MFRIWGINNSSKGKEGQNFRTLYILQKIAFLANMKDEKEENAISFASKYRRADPTYLLSPTNLHILAALNSWKP